MKERVCLLPEVRVRGACSALEVKVSIKARAIAQESEIIRLISKPRRFTDADRKGFLFGIDVRYVRRF